jgi:hypothetical protein
MSTQIDMGLQATGFVVNKPMEDARLMVIDEDQRTATNRDDRPGKPNQLIFGFKLRQRPANEGELKLRGPRGFVFHEDCLPGVETSANKVFGPNTEKDWPNDYTRWLDQFKPTACVGEGPHATLTIPPGLERNNMYVFRIAVKANPQATPSRNKWTIDYASESSDPFLGFTLWTFTMTAVVPVSTAKTPTGANIEKTENPVTITFKPFNEIPRKCSTCASGGLLRVSAPAGFIFVSQNNECRVTFMETGGTSSFGYRDIRCEVDNNTKLLLHVTGDKSIAAGKEYTLIAKVYNPAGTIAASNWILESFKQKTAEPSSALDESHIPGFSINSVLNTWNVRNKNDVFNGKTQVQDVLFTMQFPDALKDGDVLQVEGPKGFNLGGGSEQKQCNEFKWPSDMNPLPNSGEPTCMCQADVCTMQFVINESKDPAYPQNEDIRFEVSSSNPPKTPQVTENFWKVKHLRGEIIKSSHVTKSWGINPQLENVNIWLTGANRAAESTSDIIIEFTPVSNADTLMLEAVFPTEFDFSKATVSPPYDVDDQTENEVIIINKANIVAGKTSRITISSVKLGRGGGATTFNLTTFKDETMMEKMDERLEFVGGFRLPGKITVSSKELKSIYASSPQAAQTFPVKSLFQARVDEHARAEFTLTFSQRVTASQRLIIQCQGEGAYELQDSDFIILGTTTIETTVERDATGALVATLMPGNPDTQTALQADTPYQVFMGVRPKAGSNTWKFETTDGHAYPTNTNDGNTPGFNPVAKMTLDVQAQRSPPRAVIEVVLNVDRGNAIVKQLLIIAPPAFVFPPDDCGDMCQAGQALGSTGRKTATISSPTGEALTKLEGLRIKVQTPERDPVPLDWYVEGRGQGAGTTTGWGEGPGFKITQMRGTRVSYAGVANLQGGRMTFTFSLDRNNGAQIAVEPPQGYQLSCSSEGALAQISLPGGTPDCTDDPLTLMLNETLVSGDYAFGIFADMPPETPAPNNFNLIIRDREGNVVDAMYGIPGKNIVPLKVGTPTLSWARSEAGQPSLITVGITFEQDTEMVKALLITFPDNFIHDIQKPTDVRNLNKRFPVAASTDWADTLHTDRIKILLDDTDDVTTIMADTYKFNFPVLVPCCTQADMPRDNVWYLSLCQSRSCRKPTDTGSVLVAFPMAGFNLGELSPETLRRSEGGAVKQTINGITMTVSAGAALAATSL